MSAQYNIEDSQTLNGLIDKVSKYDISILGSLTISNGHYYQSLVGVRKVEPLYTAAQVEILEEKPAVEKVKPKVTRKTKVKKVKV